MVITGLLRAEPKQPRAQKDFGQGEKDCRGVVVALRKKRRCFQTSSGQDRGWEAPCQAVEKDAATNIRTAGAAGGR